MPFVIRVKQVEMKPSFTFCFLGHKGLLSQVNFNTPWSVAKGVKDLDHSGMYVEIEATALS